MSRALGPGRASLAGLRWLASVGPAPLDAWGTAMGWATSTAFSHAARLVDAGLAAYCPMRRGGGSLYYATRAGVRDSGLIAAATTGAPAPATWAHWSACAWTAAWLTSRERQVMGSRELQVDERWHGELEWLEHDGPRRRGHHPDLATALAPGGRWLPIEVELASKSVGRLRSILSLHADWIAAGKTDAVIYVCGSEAVAERVGKRAVEAGLSPKDDTLRIETVAAISELAMAASGRETWEPRAAATGR